MVGFTIVAQSCSRKSSNPLKVLTRKSNFIRAKIELYFESWWWTVNFTDIFENLRSLTVNELKIGVQFFYIKIFSVKELQKY